jgi:hypothetical protein
MINCLSSFAAFKHRFVRPCLGALVAAAAATALAGCGGGVAVGLDLGYAQVIYETDFDERPNVSVAVSSNTARVGQTVRVIAAASDDFGVEEVIFYSVRESGEAEYISDARRPPYAIDVVIPSSPSGVIYFMARAVDTSGQYRDSALSAVTVLP